MNRNRKKKNRKKETGAVVSLLLASSLAFGGCGTAVTSASFVNTESASTESTGETSADNAAATSESTASENAIESASDIDFDLELTESTIDTEFTDREKSGSYKASEAVTDRTSLSRPAVSHHLKILKDTGLIDVLKKGVCNYYYLTNKSAIDKLGRLKEELEKYPES